MPTTSDAVQSTTSLPNGVAVVERLESLVRQIQEECSRLRQALAKTEAERDRYRQLFLSQARDVREFEHLDIPTLEAMTAGPVEPIR